MSVSTVDVARDLWWIGVVEGAIAVLFGVAAVFWPGLTVVTLVYLFGADVLVWSVFEMLRGVMSVGKSNHWFLTLIFGLFGLGVGVYLVRHPAVTFTTLILLIGFVLIVRGLVDIISPFLEKGVAATSKVLSIIAGIVALVVGIVVLREPVSGGVAFVWLLGLFALVFGTVTIAMAFDVRKALEAKR
jgi:uncharacterized membrane protein HdeD (DUF308 family)